MQALERARTSSTNEFFLPNERPAELRSGTILAFPAGCSYRKRLEDWLGIDGTTVRPGAGTAVAPLQGP